MDVLTAVIDRRRRLNMTTFTIDADNNITAFPTPDLAAGTVAAGAQSFGSQQELAEDPELAMAGILLHDAGKAIEYEGSVATRRGRRGILQGHVVLGYQLVRRAAIKAKLDPDRAERLEHIILSHQGKLEWGAAALAATPEAVFVSKD